MLVYDPPWMLQLIFGRETPKGPDMSFSRERNQGERPGLFRSQRHRYFEEVKLVRDVL